MKRFKRNFRQEVRKMANEIYSGSIEIIDGFKPMNKGEFYLMNSKDIFVLEKWDKRVNGSEPDRKSDNVADRIQGLEDDKVSRHGDSTLKGHYEIIDGGLRVGE
jgi:hypothetical protein